MLQCYLGALPAQLIQGLADQARDLYNAFNRSDHDNDKLNGLWLPVTGNGKIEIEFVGSLGVRYDALVILSEGHIRCLGLAILLAKTIEQHCPVVIFDDVAEFLAAEWVAKQLALGVPLQRLQGLFASDLFGQPVLIPARRASLSWLAADEFTCCLTP